MFNKFRVSLDEANFMSLIRDEYIDIKTERGMIRLVLSESELYNLCIGEIIETEYALVALQDIGYDRILIILNDKFN